MHLLLPDQRPEVPECRIKRSLSRNIPLGSSLRLDKVGIDIIRSIIVTLLLESNSREVVWPNILVPERTDHASQNRSQTVLDHRSEGTYLFFDPRSTPAVIENGK